MLSGDYRLLGIARATESRTHLRRICPFGQRSEVESERGGLRWCSPPGSHVNMSVNSTPSAPLAHILTPLLHIQAPPGCEAERAYILGVVFGDWLGQPYRLTQSAREDVCIRLSDQPGELRLPDRFFSQFRKASVAWLSDASLPRVTAPGHVPSWDSRSLASDILLTDPIVPILYEETAPVHGVGRPRESVTPSVVIDGQSRTCEGGPQGDRIDLPLDIFGSAFFMLTRYEEAVLPDRDDHDRFPATASLAHRVGFLHRPIVDEYVEILWSALHRVWPGLQRKPLQARTLVSCDVDSAFGFDGALGRLPRRLAADLLRRRSPSLAWRNLRGQLLARWGDHSLDPHRLGLDYIMDRNERAGLAVAFNFISENTHPRLDNRVSLDDPRLRALLRQISRRGHEIGLHAGYNSYLDQDAMARSVATLRRVLDEEGIDQSQLERNEGQTTFLPVSLARFHDLA
jgi:hypothetical protein